MKQLFAAAAIAALCLILPSSAEAQVGPRLIVSQVSNKCLDVPGISNFTPGTPLQLFDCEWNRVDYSGKPSDQFWVFGPQGNIQNSLSGLCIDITSPANGTPVQIAPCDGRPSQVWRVSGNGFVQHSSTGKCIGIVPSPAPVNETPLMLSDCELNNPRSLQLWRWQ